MDKLTEQLAAALRDFETFAARRSSELGGLSDDMTRVHATACTALAAYDAAIAGTSKALRDGTLAGTAEPHTPEPWGYSRRSEDLSAVFEAAGGTCHLSIAETCNKAHHANARRIVACVNACAGMSTEQLEELDNGQLADIGHYWLRDS